MSVRFWEFALVLVAVSWGGTFIPVQMSMAHIDVFSFLFWRFTLAAFFMWLFSLKFGIKFDKKSVIYGWILGLMLLCDFACQTYALNFTLSSSVAFVLGLNIVIVPFLLFVFLKKKISIFAVIGAITAFLGLYFLSGTGGLTLGFGESLTIISAFMYALHIVFTGVYVSKTNIYALVVMQFVCVSVCSFFLAIFSNHQIYPNQITILNNLIFSPAPIVAFSLIITALVATVFAFFVQTLAQRHVAPVKTVLIFALEPVSAGIIGYFFGENLSNLQIFGAILILTGILTSELGDFVMKHFEFQVFKFRQKIVSNFRSKFKNKNR